MKVKTGTKKEGGNHVGRSHFEKVEKPIGYTVGLGFIGEKPLFIDSAAPAIRSANGSGAVLRQPWCPAPTGGVDAAADGCGCALLPLRLPSSSSLPLSRRLLPLLAFA